jgi:hypothetical protein
MWKNRKGGDIVDSMRWGLVAGVPEEDVRRLVSVARRPRFSRGEVVFHRDDPTDSLHLIQKGRFAVRVITPLGDAVTVAARGFGDSFGEMALVADGPRSATVAALEEAETLAVYQAEFHRLRKEHPQVEPRPNRLPRPRGASPEPAAARGALCAGGKTGAAASASSLRRATTVAGARFL